MSIREKRSEVIIIVIFVLINVGLFIASSASVDGSGQLHPTFTNASDGQRYWGVAVNLARDGRFVIGDESVTPLARAGPVPAIVFSIPIKLFGLENSAGWIVAGQCVLLYLTGIIFGRLGRAFNVNENLVCGLIVFNPNLITLAHHAQSDLLFTFVLAALLGLLVPILREGNVAQKSNILWLGIFAGLLPLTRPLGFYVLLLTPVFFVLSRLVSPNPWKTSSRKTILGFFVAALTATIIMLPWAYRNYLTFDQVSLTQSEGVMMQWHYNALTKKIGNPDIMPNLRIYMEKYGVTEDCANDVRCRGGLTQAYFSAIAEIPRLEVLKALVLSYASLFFSGGASQLGRYLGLEPVNFSNFLTGNRGLALEARRIKSLFFSEAQLFMIFVLGAIVFAIVTRICGLVGVIYSVAEQNARALSFLFLLIIVSFLGMYLFSSIARFRAPIEPILAVYAAVGITYFLSRDNKIEDSQFSR